MGLRTENGVTFFACTSEDMAMGGGPLPLDPKSRVMPTPEEHAALLALNTAHRQLKGLGWQDAMYAPRDGTALEVIEVGSTGIHKAMRDDKGRFWIYDGDEWPSNPCLFRIAKATGAA